MEYGARIFVRKNEILLSAGEITPYCYVVESGTITAFEYDINGNKRIYTFNKSDSIIMESLALYQVPAPVNFEAITDSSLIRIDRQTLAEAISADSEIAFDIIASLSGKFLYSMGEIQQSKNFNTSWRVCNVFIALAKQFGIDYDGKVLIHHKISQNLISQALGVNRITVVNIVSDLKAMGLIEQINGFYCIRSIEALKRHQEFLKS